MLNGYNSVVCERAHVTNTRWKSRRRLLSLILFDFLRADTVIQSTYEIMHLGIYICDWLSSRTWAWEKASGNSRFPASDLITLKRSLWTLLSIMELSCFKGHCKGNGVYQGDVYSSDKVFANCHRHKKRTVCAMRWFVRCLLRFSSGLC